MTVLIWALAAVAALTAIAASGQSVVTSNTETLIVAQAATPRPPAEDQSIRPFKIHVPQAALDDLRRRIAASRWPDKETVAAASQGAQLARLQELVRYWGTDYDWRRVEAKLNSLPQFVTTIDGVDIHFIHVKSRRRR